MYSCVERDEAYRRDLLDHIQRAYGIRAVGLSEAPRGFYGETWKVDTAAASYFVKVDYSSRHRAVFRASLAVVDHLGKHGIARIPMVHRTKDGQLYAPYESAVLALFDWVEGENVENEITKIAEYQILAQVYAVPFQGTPITRETFGTSCLDSYAALSAQLHAVRGDDSSRALRAILSERSALLRHIAARLRLFAARCGGDARGFHITHGDAGGNIIISDGAFYLVDWDDPKLAPPERDAWFCMDRQWAMDAFADALRGQGIAYKLKPERLAYYYYHSFISYLVEWLVAFHDLPHMRHALLEGIAGYFDGWIMNSLSYADGIA